MGALIAGVYADRYSRRYSIVLASGTSFLQKDVKTFYPLDSFSVIFCIGSAFQCGAQNLSHLIIGRALGGVGVGALRPVI